MRVLRDVGDGVHGAREEEGAASTSQPGARPASRIPTEATTVAATATRADRYRRMSTPAASPAMSAPSGDAATAAPNSTLASPSSALIDG
ncbi:hypothetical protein BC477_05935 [Clavibacter michiganensis subsp. michiganensis]|uniref:Uncharacterized protein n=1 Tax=Clavibacter michiganensis subsp. michiganensis TaxID=33013 RepID=A0A251XL96_CLAMM|nr:hypothetical protein BC477_05935 [Clavibacter michiganensis subsp. michiganensis]OUE04255.1 hypothetical protein CMMCAS07_04865 [Clavibacter michiganensis subsp. michiganensis]